MLRVKKKVIFEERTRRDGVLLSKGSYVDDSKEGLWTNYWTTGGLCWTAYYKHGEPIGYVVNYNRQPINIIFTTSFLL